jgi:hypothetical protein
MSWTIKCERPGKETVYKDYYTPSQATDAMIIAIDRMREPITMTLTNDAGISVARLEIKPDGVQLNE